jgi:bromodomain and PHD finger-containing protein 1
MVLEFDVKTFLQNIKATKPPYECPFEGCAKIYKTYLGMRFHLYNFDHFNNRVTTDADKQSVRKRGQWHHRHNSSGRSPSPPDFLRTSNREALTYAESQKMVEFDIDGRVHRININEPLDIIHLDGKNGDLPLNGGIISNSDRNSSNNNNSINHINNSNNNNRKSSCDSQLTPTTNGKTAKAGKGKNRNGKCGNKGRKEQPQQQVVNNGLTLKLPEPSFRVIEDYEPPDAKQRCPSYYRYIEKSIEDIDEEVEYDMDEEDTAWLDLINKKRRDDHLPEVPADTFELLMDRLEKESYFQSQNSGKDVGPAIDEDAVCCICNDGECQNSNAILFCDMCNLAVHQECYGVPYIPEGQWLCRRCLQSPSRAVDCVLCPNKGGAFKQTDDNRWSHVVCALWIPEVCFANTVFLEPIDSIANIPSARWKLSCYICKQRSVGACIQCHKANCYVAFHVTCAQQAGLYMKMEAVKEMTSSGLVTNVKKAAYCDAHTPADENGTTLSGVYSSGEEDSRSELKRMQLSKAKFKEKMKKARKILAEKRSAIPIVSIPTIPLERLTKIAAMISIPKRNQFLQRLLGYWTLKRQSRNGVPLLRRLQISHNHLRKDMHKEGDNERIVKLKEEFKFVNRLRQDLERARLLVELLRKREKYKRELLHIHQNTVEYQLIPFNIFLKNVLSKLEEKDTNSFFAEPVNIEEVPDYLQFVHNPMDFSTMKAKIDKNFYNSFDLFEKDFNLIIENCLFYNEKDTVYHKSALKLREHGISILKEAKKRLDIYNIKTGLHAKTSPNEIQVSVRTVVSQKQQLEDKLKQLEQNLTKAKQQKSGGSRTKRVRSLTAEIANIKDQIKLCTNTSPSFVNTKQQNVSLLQHFQRNAVFNSNNRVSPEKQKQKSPKSKNLNSIMNSDSDTTDICENNATFSHFIDKIEGRKTYNSVSASINSSEIEGLIKSNSPNKSNSITNHKGLDF